ncbi:MAG TPA: hypothetical protein VK658_01110 [Chryseolinea sp.]|nr:hypothetical protein [Chryseolinea sp.]
MKRSIVIIAVVVFLVWLSYGIIAPTIDGVGKSGQWGDTFGAFSALINGFALLATAFAGIYIFRTYHQQVKEIAENRLFKELDNFAQDKIQVGKGMDDVINSLHTSVEQTIKNEYGKSVPPKDKLVSWYFSNLELEFIRDYSIQSQTPRLKPYYVNYFKHINTICYLFIDLIDNGHADHFKHLRSILLSRMSEGELKMVCYYYYLFYDVVNSRDQNFTCENPVKISKVFEDNLHFSDDFSRNLDPRENHFDSSLRSYRAKYADYRKDNLSLEQIRRL